MFNLLLIIISYGSLLVLLMPATGTGIMLTAVIFALGIVLIVLKKDRIAVRKPTKKNKLHRLAFFFLFCCRIFGHAILSALDVSPMVFFICSSNENRKHFTYVA